MADIEILSPGLYTSVQDLGRFGHAANGIPTSGAMDSLSARKANLLLNNDPNAALLEITMTGPRLRFNCSARIAVCGAVFKMELDGTALVNDRAYHVTAGQQLTFGPLQEGLRTYLAFAGGLDFPVVLGSRSMYPGITKESQIKKNKPVPLLKTFQKEFAMLSKVRFPSEQYSKNESIFSDQIEAVPGPEYNLLNAEHKERLTKMFTIAATGNRMAVSLNEKISNTVANITTAPVMPGTVQLTPSGTLIALMRDCQVSGGYPRILQLTEQGINRLSQTVPGRSIFFKLIGV